MKQPARRVAVLTALLLVVATVPARASSPSTSTKKQGVDAQIQSLRQQVDEASQAEAQLLGQIDATRAHKADLDARIDALDAQITGAQAELNAAQARLDAAEAHVHDTETRLDEARVQFEDAKHELQRRAVAAYTGQSVLNGYADLVLRVRTMRELAASGGYIQAVIDVQTAAVRRYKRLRDEVQQLRDDLGSERDQAVSQRDGVAGKKAGLEASRRTQDGLRAALGGELAQEASLLAQVNARKGEFTAQLAALQHQSDLLGQALRQVQQGQHAGTSGHGFLSSPIPGAAITSYFGPRVHPIFGDVRMHTGIDFGANTGTPIHAAADGVVVSAGDLGGYGNATVISHGNALATLYAHQSAIFVTAGTHVTRGQVIGLVGCTGFCTGPHLHFEVRINGDPVDPLLYL